MISPPLRVEIVLRRRERPAATAACHKVYAVQNKSSRKLSNYDALAHYKKVTLLVSRIKTCFAQIIDT